MDTGKKNKLKLYGVIILGIIGLFVSLYLLQSHYAPQEGTVCDINSTLSCSIVNSSSYSELFNVPLALLGAFWFVIVIYLAYITIKQQSLAGERLYYWIIIGLLFIVYMVYGEYMVGAICLACTLVHIIIIALFFLARKFHSVDNRLKDVLNGSIRFVSIILLMTAALFLIFNDLQPQTIHDDLAKCLTDNGAIMYSSYICSHCQDQKDMFGDSFKFIAEVECHPDGPNSQYQICAAKNITSTPTWTIEKDGEELKRHIGVMSLDDLSSWVGCS